MRNFLFFESFSYLPEPIYAVLPLLTWAILMAALAKLISKDVYFSEITFFSILGGVFGFLFAKSEATYLGQIAVSAIGIVTFFGTVLLKRDNTIEMKKSEKDFFMIGVVVLCTFLVFYGYFEIDKIL